MLATKMNGKRGESGECECTEVCDIVKYTHTYMREVYYSQCVESEMIH